MDLGLKKKIVLVTGSTKGIGFTIAKSFYDEGSQVIINSRHVSELKKKSKEIGDKCDFISGDLKILKDCNEISKKIKSKYGKLDILICNVGNGTSKIPGKEGPKDLNDMINTNLFSATNIVYSTKNLLEKSKGSIVCISSIAGIETIGAPIGYSVGKAALNSFVKNISKPLGKKGIRVNVVAPGNIYFKNSVWDKKLKKNKKFVENMLKKEVALNRLGTPEDVSSIVNFLSSEKASFITGSMIIVDGGQIKS